MSKFMTGGFGHPMIGAGPYQPENWVRFFHLVSLKIGVKWFIINLLVAIVNWVRFDFFYFFQPSAFALLAMARRANGREWTRRGIGGGSDDGRAIFLGF